MPGAASSNRRHLQLRARNDRVAVAATRHRFDDHSPVPFLCECDDPDCEEFVPLTLGEYEALGALLFFTAPGHVIWDADRTGATESYDLYLVESREAVAE